MYSMAEAMQAPAGTRGRIEAGGQMFCWTILRLNVIGGVEPQWLVAGEGERHRTPPGVLGSKVEFMSDYQ